MLMLVFFFRHSLGWLSWCPLSDSHSLARLDTRRHLNSWAGLRFRGASYQKFDASHWRLLVFRDNRLSFLKVRGLRSDWAKQRHDHVCHHLFLMLSRVSLSLVMIYLRMFFFILVNVFSFVEVDPIQRRSEPHFLINLIRRSFILRHLTSILQS